MRKHSIYHGLLEFERLSNIPGIVHFSTTRQGGVSHGEFESFNLGNYSDDDPLSIFENRTILALMLHAPHKAFIVPHQRHGSKIAVIDSEFLRLNKAAQTDALFGIDATITQIKDLFLCVNTADCVPILLFDINKKAIAAIHAGWRGTVQHIVEKTLRKMTRHYGTAPSDIIAGIGPAISMKHYEVGNDVEQAFAENGFDLSPTSTRNAKSGKLHIDLKGINRQELLRLGVPSENIETADLCTFENPDLFFSARRQGVHSGRMLTGIMLSDRSLCEIEEALPFRNAPCRY